MNEQDITAQWEARFEEAGHEIASLDEFDFYNLLLESRIIQAS